MNAPCQTRLYKVENGFLVEVLSPRHSMQTTGASPACSDPWKRYVFKSWLEVIEFLDEVLTKDCGC